MVEISLTQWSNLTQAERELAKGLGITPRKARSTPDRSISKPKPYLLKARVLCYLCKSETEQFFRMVLSEDGYSLPYLHSARITREEAQELQKSMPIRPRDIYTSTCTACPEVLGKWKKEELVQKLIQVFPAARIALVTGGKPDRW